MIKRNKNRSKSSGDYSDFVISASPSSSSKISSTSSDYERLVTREGQYYGQCRNGLREGEGRFEDAAGNIYFGGWKLDQPSGFGTKAMASGARYEGFHAKGKRHGNGRYTFSNGDFYSGMWCEGAMQGKGTMMWASGDRFSGYWYRGQMHGIGIKTDTESVVKGTFSRGKVHGWARKTFYNGSTDVGKDHDIYEGNYWQDIRCGFGTYRYQGGSFLRGSWIDDVITGSGEHFIAPPINPISRLHLMYCDSISETIIYYRGSFVAGLRHGKGTAVMFDGSKYTGDWSEGEMNGWGRLEYLGGQYYEGTFEMGRKQGLGVLVYPPTAAASAGRTMVQLNAEVLRSGVLEVLAADDASLYNPDELFDKLFQPNVQGGGRSPTAGAAASATAPATAPATTVAPPFPADADADADADAADDDEPFFEEPFCVEDQLAGFRNFRRPGEAVPFAGMGTGLAHTGAYRGSTVLGDCSTYRGSFWNDEPEGVGVVELRNGITWSGTFIQGISQCRDGADEGDYSDPPFWP